MHTSSKMGDAESNVDSVSRYCLCSIRDVDWLLTLISKRDGNRVLQVHRVCVLCQLGGRWLRGNHFHRFSLDETSPGYDEGEEEWVDEEEDYYILSRSVS